LLSANQWVKTHGNYQRITKLRSLDCFKAYDIRGELGTELSPSIAYDIGAAFAQSLSPRSVVLGCDCRESSARLKQAVADGLTDMGVDVIDIGMCGTEEVYFATDHLRADGGIEITASHNPITYNGMKLVGAGARPLDPETEIGDIRVIAEKRAFMRPGHAGTQSSADIRTAYADKILSFAEPARLKCLKILVNAGNGAAGPAFDEIARKLDKAGAPLEFIRMDHAPDGRFPHGIPNPLLPENQPRTSKAVRDSGADFGVAWDGDFDRCFFFDDTGAFIDGYYIVGLLAQQALLANPAATVIHDPRMIWNTQDIVSAAGGKAVQARTGHAHLKAAMRRHDAIYGGEMSAHHYFRDFMYCDSGMIPWLMVAELVSQSGKSLRELVVDMQAAFPGSGERNFRIADPAAALAKLEQTLGPDAKTVDHLDGLSMDFGDWRLNLRPSSTEPLVRLNLESRADQGLIARQLTRVMQILGL